MALYRHKQYLEHSDQRAFDLLHRPGDAATNSGIYRCEACGAETVCEKSNRLPRQDQHLHEAELGPIQWRLIVLIQPQGGLGVTVEGRPTPSRSPGRELAVELDDDAD